MKNFTKEDLKPGMLIESRGMGLRMVMPYGAGYLAFVDQQGFYWAFDDDLKLDLTDSNGSEFDIMKVYGYSSKASESMRFDTHNRELLWEREEESEEESNDEKIVDMYVNGKKIGELDWNAGFTFTDLYGIKTIVDPDSDDEEVEEDDFDDDIFDDDDNDLEDFMKDNLGGALLLGLAAGIAKVIEDSVKNDDKEGK